MTHDRRRQTMTESKTILNMPLIINEYRGRCVWAFFEKLHKNYYSPRKQQNHNHTQQFCRWLRKTTRTENRRSIALCGEALQQGNPQ